MSSAKKSTPSRASSKQQALKFVVKSKNVNELPGPFLATFGAFPALESIDPTGSDPLLFDAFTVEKKQLAKKNATPNDNNIFQQQYILKGETEKLEYCSTKNDSARANHSKYLIGIFDPSKNEVELVPTPGVFVMQQATKNVKLFFETQEEDNKKRNARTLQVFGASGAKALAKRITLDSLQEGSGNVTEGMANELRQRLAGNLENVKEGKRDAYLDLPSPNIHTENVQEVYDSSKLIPDTIWSVIPRMTGDVPNKVASHNFHEATAKLVERLQTQKSNLANKILKERLVVYAALLGALVFKRNKRGFAISEITKRHHVQYSLAEHILSTFSAPDSSGNYAWGQFTRAKCMLYATTAVLLAFDLSLDQEIVDTLGNILQASPEEMKVLLTRIGCTVTKTGAQLVEPWKVWKRSEAILDPIELRLKKATHRALEREKANRLKGQKQAAEDADPSAMNIEEAEEQELAAAEEDQAANSNMNDDDDDFVSGTKGGEKKKRGRKSIGEKAKEDPLNKKKKM